MNTNPFTLLEEYIQKEKSIKDFSDKHIELMLYVLRLDMDYDTKSLYIQSIGKEIDLLLSIIDNIEKEKKSVFDIKNN